MSEQLDTNFNVPPYYDDFDEEKRFHRILFKPRMPVQARELTQLQTYGQNQLQRLADYTFKDGAIVDGCAITYIPQFDFVHLVDQFDGNTNFAVSNLNDDEYLVTNGTDSNTAVRAVIRIAKDGYIQQYPATNRFYVNYIVTGNDISNNEIATFNSGETLYIYDSNQPKFGILDANNLFDTISVLTANGTANSTGRAYGISVSDGIVYQKGMMIEVEPHTITVSDFNQNTTGYVVGFSTSEEIVSAQQDPSLYDNALGYPAYGAEGADRLKMTSSLIAKQRSAIANTDSFFAIVEFDGDQPTEQNLGEESLNRLLDALATRTREESGDYVVKPFNIEPVTHTSNNQLFDYEVSPGIIYVNGYRREKVNSFRVAAPRAITVREASGQIVTANYGSYVFVNEVVGIFDADNLGEVELYDTPQNAISDYEGSTTAPSGNVIGVANVRAVVFDSGLKGTPAGRYRLYLFNIRMNNGESFADVRSVVADGTTIEAKADIITQPDGTAQLQEPQRNTLVFDTGIDAIRRLRDGNGVNDTQFVFRDVVSATLAADGTVTFTLNTPANGGDERVNASVGIVTDTGELVFDVSLGSAAYTAPLAGTVDVTSANAIILPGAGTSFTSHFVPGDMIRVNVSGAPQIRRVVQVVDNTQLVIDADIAGANTACEYAKYYPPGHIVNLSTFGGTISVISNTQFTVDTNLDLGAGNLPTGTQTTYVNYPVLRSAATQTAKNVRKNRFVKINCDTNLGGVNGPWGLGIADLHKIRHVYVGDTYDQINPDRLSWFTVDNGQRDDFYDHARLIIKPQYKNKLDSDSRILVELDYFVANTTAGIGFYSVDSYPIDDANTANVNAIQTAEIPVFYSALTDSTIDLRNAVDFRPRKSNTAADAITDGAATENPAPAANSFAVPGSGQYLTAPDSNFQADLEYYLPRIDLICINREGDIIVRSGEPNEFPVEPRNEGDTAVIARADVPPYPSLTPREGTAAGQPQNTIRTSIRTTKRSTMRDISNIADRVSRLEYYTSLNLLEQKAKDMIIPDENGVDRFKNGIFADGFNSHLLGKVNDIEYSIAIDKDRGIARPKFETNDVDFIFSPGLSSGVQKTGHLITRPYVDELCIEQRYGSKFRNATQSWWQWNGKIDLYPSYDHFRDEQLAPAINIDLDLTAPWEAFVDSPFATIWGDWRTVGQNTTTSTNRSTTRTGTTTTTTRTTTTDSERISQQLQIEDILTNEYQMGEYVTDFSINPFIRSRVVAFIGSGLKPNTRVHAFFDNTNVDDSVAPGEPSGITDVESGDEDRIITRTGNWGDPLIADLNGHVYGVFNIPPGMFRTGDRSFLLTNVDDLETGADAQISKATAIYTASSISVTKQSSTLTTHQPEVRVVDVVETRRNVSTTRTTTTQRRFDPIAQTFDAVVPGDISGMFITKIGVYFQSKSDSLGVACYLMETTVGYPDSSKIIGTARLEPGQVTTSADGSVETIFTFNSPVYLSNHGEYSFMIVPDGNNPDYNVWCAEVGGFDTITGEQIFSNPYIGTLFVSANANAWTPLQKEDMKFNIYRASFDVGSGSAVFVNEDDDYITVDGFTKANTTYRVNVGDIVVVQDANGDIISDSSNVNFAYGIIQWVDEADGFVYIDRSNGNFTANTTIEIHRPQGEIANVSSFDSDTLIATSEIQSIDNIEYHAVVPRFATLEPARTSIRTQFRGTDQSLNFDSNWIAVQNDYEQELLDKARFAYSRSNEVDLIGGNKTTQFQLTLATDNRYLSPVIDLHRKSSLMISNLVNNDSTNEHLQYGNAASKYVSRNITLSPNLGNAEDLKVLVSGYRPVGTDIVVFAKIIGSDDGDPFDSKLWTRLEPTTGSAALFSSPQNVEDFREFEFRLPESVQETVGNRTTAYLNDDGHVEYARADGAIVVGFSTFCIKIVLLATSGHNVPRLNDVIAIALQA